MAGLVKPYLLKILKKKLIKDEKGFSKYVFDSSGELKYPDNLGELVKDTCTKHLWSLRKDKTKNLRKEDFGDNGQEDWEEMFKKEHRANDDFITKDEIIYHITTDSGSLEKTLTYNIEGNNIDGLKFHYPKTFHTVAWCLGYECWNNLKKYTPEQTLTELKNKFDKQLGYEEVVSEIDNQLQLLKDNSKRKIEQKLPQKKTEPKNKALAVKLKGKIINEKQIEDKFRTILNNTYDLIRRFYISFIFSIVGVLLIGLFYLASYNKKVEPKKDRQAKLNTQEKSAFNSISKDSLQILVLRFTSNIEENRDKVHCPGENIAEEIKEIITQRQNTKSEKGKITSFPVKCVYKPQVLSPISIFDKNTAKEIGVHHNADIVIYGTFDSYNKPCGDGQLCFLSQPSDTLLTKANAADKYFLKKQLTDSIKIPQIRSFNRSNETHIDKLNLETWLRSVLSSKLGKNDIELFYIDPKLPKKLLSQKYYERSKINNISFTQKIKDLFSAYENNPKSIKILKEICENKYGRPNDKYFNELIKLSEVSESYLLRGQSLIERYNYSNGTLIETKTYKQKAKNDLYKALKLSPNRIETYLSITGKRENILTGSYDFRKGFYSVLEKSEIDSLLNRGIYLAKNNTQYLSDLYAGKANIKLQFKDTFAFINNMKKAILLEPKKEFFRNSLIGIYKKQKKKHLIIEEYKSLIKSDSTNYFHYESFGNYFYRIKDYENAEKQYKSSLIIDEYKGSGRLGYFYLSRGNIKLALENFTKQIELDTTGNYSLFNNRIRVRKKYLIDKTSNFNARKEVISLIRKDYEMLKYVDNYYLEEYADFLKQNKFYNEALSLYDSIILKFPSRNKAYWKKAEIYATKKNKEEVFKNYELAIINGYIYFQNIINYCIRNKDTINEKIYIKKYWENTGRKRFSLISDSKYFKEEEKKKEADRLLKVIKKENGKTTIYKFLCNYHYKKKNLNKTNYYLEKWIKSNSENFYVPDLKKFDKNKTISILKNIIRKHSKDYRYYRILGEFYEYNESNNNAFELLKKSVSLSENKQKSIKRINDYLRNRKDTINGNRWFKELTAENTKYLYDYFKFLKDSYSSSNKNKEKLETLNEFIFKDSIVNKEINPEYLIDKSELLFVMNQKNKALEILNKLDLKNHKDLLLRRAQLYKRYKYFKKVLEDYNSLVKIDSSYIYNRGEYFFEQKKYRYALKDYENTIRYKSNRNQNTTYLYDKVASIYCDQEEWNKAIEVYTSILKIDSTAINYLKKRSQCYIAKKKFEKAFNDIDRIGKYLETNKTYSENYKYIKDSSSAFAKKGDIKSSIKLLRKSIECDINYLKKDKKDVIFKYFNLATRLKSQDNKKGVLSILNEIIKIDTTSKNFLRRAEFYFLTDDFDNGVEDIINAKKLDSANELNEFDYEWVFGNKLYNLKEKEEWDKLINIYTELLKIESKGSYYNGRAIGFTNEKEYELALKDYDSAIFYSEEKTGKSSFLREKVRLLVKLKHFKEAESELKKAIKHSPKEANNYSVFAYLFKKRELQDEAIKMASKAIELNDTIAFYFNYRGTIHYNFKNYNEALNDYNIALKIDSLDRWYNHNKGDVLVKLGQPREALRFYSKVELDTKFHFYYHILITYVIYMYWYISIPILLLFILFFFRKKLNRKFKLYKS